MTAMPAMPVGIVKIGQPSDFVSMQLVPHYMRQLLNNTATADPHAVESLSSQNAFFKMLLQEVHSAGTAMAPVKSRAASMHLQPQPQQLPQQQQNWQQQQLQPQQQYPDYQQHQQQQNWQQQQTQQWNQPQHSNPMPSPPREQRMRPTKTYTRCDLAQVQAVFDPLVERAMLAHSDPAGQEGVAKGVRELYAKVQSGELPAGVEDDLAKIVEAVANRDLAKAGQLRDKIVRTTTTGWVQGGTWQWALKHLIAAAR